MITRRISPIAKPGALLKAPREKRGGRRPRREMDAKHLALIRRLPCLSCDADPTAEAAHLRLGVPKGMGLKADDRWSVPLCHDCHMEQHATGEIVFWLRLGLDPIRIAAELHRVSPNLPAMRAVVFKQREVRK